MEIAVVLFFFGLSAGAVGKIKGSSFLIWFLIGLVLPGLGTLAAVLYRFEGKEPPRSCPECGNVMPIYQQVCSRCGRDLEFPAESPVSQQGVV
jgi:hypothetical protein